MAKTIYSQCETLQFVDHGFCFESSLCLVKANFFTLQKKAKYFLHPEEITLLNRFVSEKRKYSYLLGRYAAKQAFTHSALSISPSDVLIKSGSFYQPVVFYPKGNLHITLAHCGQSAICLTFSETHPMGIDLEEITMDKNFAITSKFSSHEKCFLSTRDFCYEKGALLLWTLKEALSKALRTGLTSPLKIYEVINIQTHDNCWVSQFKYFPQYQGYSFLIGNLICSLVYPQHISLTAKDLSFVER